MKWLTSNLYVLAILGAVLLLGSFVRLQFVKPNKIAFGLGVLLLIAVVVGVVQVIRNPPGPDDIAEEEQDIPVPVVPDSALAQLRLEWDSESAARWPAAISLAKISDIAYEPPHAAHASYEALGFTEIMPVVEGSMIGYVITGEDVTVCAFRGTDFAEVSDWLANLGRSPTDTPHGPVHKGFFNAYQSMKSQVDAILKDRDTTHLWVTGHSLGGALALFCAYDLVEVEQRPIDGVITFGQPMIARQQFADYLDELLVGRYARFVNRDDIVPKVPPSHVACGSLVWFTDTGVRRSKVRRMTYSAQGTDEPPVEEGPADAEITPLTEAEFASLQAELKAENANTERLPEGTPMAYGAAPSFIDDHYMSHYVDEVRSLLGVTDMESPQ